MLLLDDLVFMYSSKNSFRDGAETRGIGEENLALAGGGATGNSIERAGSVLDSSITLGSDEEGTCAAVFSKVISRSSTDMRLDMVAWNSGPAIINTKSSVRIMAHFDSTDAKDFE